VLATLGALMTLPLVFTLVPALWVEFAYRPATAVVEETRTTIRPGYRRQVFALQALVRFTADGHDYRAWVDLPGETREVYGPEAQAVRRQANVGQSLLCFHDPVRPARGVVFRLPATDRSLLVGILFALAFLVVGCAGLIDVYRRRRRRLDS
jgi:hypothetical protein